MRFLTYVQMQTALTSDRAAPGSCRTADSDPMLCEYTLRKVLSFLEIPELLSSAALVSRRWSQASLCKEVWRRRMHKHVLDMFRHGVIPSHPSVSAVRLFHCLYRPNLLQNAGFLERANAAKLAGASKHAWEATYNPRGMTWAHPFDFFPELSPLPTEDANKKPFSVGCLAVGPSHLGWSEMVQVVDLSAAMQSNGLPADLAEALLTSELTLELSLYVAGGAITGGEYQIVTTLMSAADAAAAQNNAVPFAAVPKITVPFGHPPAGSAGVAATAAANLKDLGFTSSKTLANAPLQPTPGDWTHYTCRFVLRKDTPVSHVLIALRGRASRTRHGHFATKFAEAQLSFVTADNC